MEARVSYSRASLVRFEPAHVTAGQSIQTNKVQLTSPNPGAVLWLQSPQKQPAGVRTSRALRATWAQACAYKSPRVCQSWSYFASPPPDPRLSFLRWDVQPCPQRSRQGHSDTPSLPNASLRLLASFSAVSYFYSPFWSMPSSRAEVLTKLPSSWEVAANSGALSAGSGSREARDGLCLCFPHVLPCSVLSSAV